MSVNSVFSPDMTVTPSCEVSGELSQTLTIATSDPDVSQIRSVENRIAWFLWPINIGVLVLAAVLLVIEQDGPFRDAATWFFAGLLFAVLKIALKYWIG